MAKEEGSDDFETEEEVEVDTFSEDEEDVSEPFEQ